MKRKFGPLSKKTDDNKRKVKAECSKTRQNFSKITSFADILEKIEHNYRQRCKRFLQLNINFYWPELQPCLDYVFDHLQTSKNCESKTWQLFFKGLTIDHVKDLMNVGQLFLGVEAQMIPLTLKSLTHMNLGFIMGCYDWRLNTNPIFSGALQSNSLPNVLVFLETTTDKLPCTPLQSHYFVSQTTSSGEMQVTTIERDWKCFAKKVYDLELKLEIAQHLFSIGPAQMKVVFSAECWKGEIKKKLSQILHSWFHNSPHYFGRHLTILYELYQRDSFLLVGY